MAAWHSTLAWFFNNPRGRLAVVAIFLAALTAFQQHDLQRMQRVDHRGLEYIEDSVGGGYACRRCHAVAALNQRSASRPLAVANLLPAGIPKEGCSFCIISVLREQCPSPPVLRPLYITAGFTPPLWWTQFTCREWHTIPCADPFKLNQRRICNH